MVEQSYTCECHCYSILVACFNNIVITYRTTCLCYKFHTTLMCTFYVVTEWEESIRAKAHAGHFAQIFLLFLSGQRGGLLGEGLGPHIVANQAFQ